MSDDLPPDTDSSYVQVHVQVDDLLMVFDFLHTAYNDVIYEAVFEFDSTTLIEFCIEYMDDEDLEEILDEEDSPEEYDRLVASCEEWQRTLRKKLAN